MSKTDNEDLDRYLEKMTSDVAKNISKAKEMLAADTEDNIKKSDEKTIEKRPSTDDSDDDDSDDDDDNNDKKKSKNENEEVEKTKEDQMEITNKTDKKNPAVSADPEADEEKEKQARLVRENDAKVKKWKDSLKGVGNKGLGKSGSKRHKFKARDNSNAISKGSVRRLCRRAGIKRISGELYESVRKDCRDFVTKIVTGAITYCQHSRRRTIILPDMLNSFKIHNQYIYGV